MNRCKLCGGDFAATYREGVVVAYRCDRGHTPIDSLTVCDIQISEPWIKTRPQDWAPAARAIIFRQRESE